jgi:hypothetical protein
MAASAGGIRLRPVSLDLTSAGPAGPAAGRALIERDGRRGHHGAAS